MQYIHEAQTHLKILITPEHAIRRTEQGDIVGKILQFLMRNYEELFRKEKKIDLRQITNILELNFDQVQKQLSLMEKEKIVKYQQFNTDFKLLMKVPREDNFTLNNFLEKTKVNNKQKENKIAYMLDYAFEKSECKRNKILRYFGEKKSDCCHQCSGKSCQKK